MTIDMPNLSPNARLNTAQAARALGVDRKTIRRWEGKGYISPRFNVLTGRPYWRGGDLVNLWKKLTA